MATDSTSRGLRKQVTGAVVVVMFLLTYLPAGPYLEQALSPTAFMLWVVIVAPAIVVLVFMYNARENIKLDRELDAAGTGGGE